MANYHYLLKSDIFFTKAYTANTKSKCLTTLNRSRKTAVESQFSLNVYAKQAHAIIVPSALSLLTFVSLLLSGRL